MGMHGLGMGLAALATANEWLRAPRATRMS
jgi:hypothetical protein